MPEKNFTYFAFISYSHRDSKWAAWIQNQLEHYHLPAVARKEMKQQGVELPKNIRPVFRDATDLAPGELKAHIQQELQESKFLVVICSPNSAHVNADGKNWVDEEVKSFIRFHGKTNVIPVIVDGEPFPKDPANACFSPSLADADILGLDVKKIGRERTLNDLVATILDLKPDHLWNRHRREVKKQRIIRACTSAVLLAVLALLAIYMWDSRRHYSEFFEDYVDSFGMPYGINPILPKDLHGRNSFYRFDFKGYTLSSSPHKASARHGIFGKRILRQVSHVDSFGNLAQYNFSEYLNRPIVQKFNYDEKASKLLSVEHYGPGYRRGTHGILQKTLSFSSSAKGINDVISFRTPEAVLPSLLNGCSTELVFNSEAGVYRTVSNIAQYKLTRAPEQIKTEYLNSNGAPERDSDDIYGFVQKLDEQGRILEITYIGKDGRQTQNKFGIASVKYTYTPGISKPTEVIYADEKGIPTVNHFGWKKALNTFDNKGNYVKCDFVDENGKPFVNKSGYASIHLKYDANGTFTGQQFLDGNGKPTSSADGYASIKLTADEAGNIIKSETFDNEGNRTVDSQTGTAGWTMDFPENNQTVQSFFSTKWLPAINKTLNVSSIKTSFDEDGSPVSVRFFGVDGAPAANMIGVAGWNSSFTNRKLTRCDFIGIHGKTSTSAYNFASYSLAYNQQGNVSKIAFWDANGNPVLTKDAIASIIFEHDMQGHELSRTFLGLDGLPTVNMQNNINCAGFLREYENGRETLLTRIDTNGAPRKDCIIVKTKYDGDGNKIKVSFLNHLKEPIAHMEGFASFVSTYSQKGREITRRYLDVNGQPVLATHNKIAGFNNSFYSNSLLKSSTFVGMDGKPTLCKNGYATVVLTYNHFGQITSEQFLDISGNPAANTQTGYAKKIMEYDKLGNNTSIALFDSNNNKTFNANKVHLTKIKHNHQHKIVDIAFFDTNNKRCKSTQNFSRVAFDFDRDGNLLSTTFFDEIDSVIKKTDSTK